MTDEQRIEQLEKRVTALTLLLDQRIYKLEFLALISAIITLLLFLIALSR